MSLRVNNNIASINVQRAMSRTSKSLNRQLERLASGLRVNRAADDASGLAVSESMRSVLAGLGQNLRNGEQAINMLQIAEGSLQEVSNVLVRMRALSTQASSGTFTDANRESINAEFNQLRLGIDQIVQATAYNGENLLAGFGNYVGDSSSAIKDSNTTGVKDVSLAAADVGTYSFVDTVSGELTLGNGLVTQTVKTGVLLDGSKVKSGTTAVANFDRLGIQVSLSGVGAFGATGDYEEGELNGKTIVVEEGAGGVFQVGPQDNLTDRIEINIGDLSASGSALNLSGLSLNNIGMARESIAVVDQAINTISNERGKLGALQNRVMFSMAFTENEIENTQSSEAAIRDADIAREAAKFSRYSILSQSANAMLVQANVTSVSALKLL